ncbi:MAG: tRNA (N6-threonylcarbamoyladenosine(37)-N6)-methyltransferase TrmO [Bacteroidales bacterium]|nr:tRNA (N6-threonylcarbamoyladenosine(37)-N6)-methyltransferase TrmO [Bacteroidales bacterium]
MEINPVAWYHVPLQGKFGLPRQAGLVPELQGTVRFTTPFDGPDAIRGLAGFDHIWLLWGFSHNPAPAGTADKLTVRPPRLGGNTRVGVFASRSPFRPNPIGLSCVRLLAIRTGELLVGGADLADGTPIYDIKPYLPYADARPDARGGFTDEVPWETLPVDFSAVRDSIPEQERAILGALLAQDPRPAYHADDAGRRYGLRWAGRDIQFCVRDGKILVLSAEKMYI